MIRQTQTYAESTVAMTVYNIIVDLMRTRDIRLNVDFIFYMSKARHLDRLDKGLFDKSILKLIDMKYISLQGHCYIVKDPKLRHIVNRNLKDIELDNNGIPIGGWNEWKIRDPEKGLIPLEGVINGIL